MNAELIIVRIYLYRPAPHKAQVTPKSYSRFYSQTALTLEPARFPVLPNLFSLLRLGCVVGRHNFLHQPGANDVLAGEFDVLDARDVAQTSHGIFQTALALHVLLRHIAIDDNAAVMTDAGQEHLHLRRGRVLTFVQNYKCVLEGAATHVGQRSSFDLATLDEELDEALAEALVQDIAEGLQVGVELLFQFAG